MRTSKHLHMQTNLNLAEEALAKKPVNPKYRRKNSFLPLGFGRVVLKSNANGVVYRRIIR